MKILITPDSFKDCLTASQVCDAICAGVSSAAPDAEIVCVPMADGGEGTMQALVDGLGGRFVECKVEDPLGRTIKAEFGLTNNGIAVIEMAQASGLTLLTPEERDPLKTTTYGTGQLIKIAMDHGARDFIIGLGGSATNDGGAGMAKALGFRFLDELGDELPDGGAALSGLDLIDTSEVDLRIKSCRFTIACDVDNPLLGPRGASVVFGPQKGASPDDVEALDLALSRYAEIIAYCMDVDVKAIPGAGAAGGLGAGCIAFLQAELKKGIDIVIDAVDLKEKIQNSALVITGEGRTDEQTFRGKTVFGVAEAAFQMGIPVIVISGSYSKKANELLHHGVARLYAIMEDGMTLDEAMRDSSKLLKAKAEQAIHDYILEQERTV